MNASNSVFEDGDSIEGLRARAEKAEARVAELESTEESAKTALGEAIRVIEQLEKEIEDARGDISVQYRRAYEAEEALFRANGRIIILEGENLSARDSTRRNYIREKEGRWNIILKR